MYTMLESSNMDTWDAIRDLDEGTNWSERNTILSMSDHFLLLEFARVRLCTCHYDLSDPHFIVFYSGSCS